MDTNRKVLINPEKHWPRLRQFVNHPTAQIALDVGMRVWCRDHAYLGDKTWEPRRGPWAYSRTDYWCSRKRPRKDSPFWYQCISACHWLRGFECALGQLAFPNYKWLIVEGENHSTAIGYAKRTTYVLDLLLWETRTAKKILNFAGYGGDCCQLTLEEEVGQLKLQLATNQAQAA